MWEKKRIDEAEGEAEEDAPRRFGRQLQTESSETKGWIIAFDFYLLAKNDYNILCQLIYTSTNYSLPSLFY